MTKLAYLTIDDSPSDKMEEKVDILKRKKIPAVFFCRGDFMEKKPKNVIYAIQQGFIIGNHAYSHTPFSKLSVQECIKEISMTDKLIDELYKQANESFDVKYFRYPFGTKGNIPYASPRVFFQKFDRKIRAVEKFLKEKRYKALTIKNHAIRIPEQIMMNGTTDSYWTRDVGEWQMDKFNAAFSYVEKRINKSFSNKKGNEIILMHDHESTHEFFEPILDKLLALNIDFVEIES